MKRLLSLLLILTFSFSYLGTSFAEEPAISSEEQPKVGVQAAPPTAPSAPQNPGTNLNQQGIPPYQRGFSGDLSDDVNIATGALTINQTDIYLPGRAGLDLVISRSYNSRKFSNTAGWLTPSQRQRIDLIGEGKKPEEVIDIERETSKNDAVGGVIGHGWSFNLFENLRAITYSGELKKTELPSDQVIATYSKGVVRFIEDRTGVFRSTDMGIQDIVKRTATGFVLVEAGGAKHYFELRYFDAYYGLEGHDIDDMFVHNGYFLLNKLEDANNNAIVFDWKPVGTPLEGRVSERKTEDKYPTPEDIKIFPTLIGEVSWATLIDPVAWIIGTFVEALYSLGQLFQPVTCTYHEVAGYTASRFSLDLMIDSFGRKVTLYYRTTAPSEECQIDHIDYPGESGYMLQYKYVYDPFGNLIEVIPPAGKSVKYSYKYHTQGLGEKYDDKGYLLTQLTYPTGAKIIYDYDWFFYDPEDKPNDSAGFVEKDRNNFSVYLAAKRTIDSNAWSYAYSGASIGDSYADRAGAGRILDFSSVKMTDPFGSVSESRFKDGLISKTIDPLGNITIYDWDPLRKNLRNAIATKGDYVTETEYPDYDEYGNPRLIAQRGQRYFSSDDRFIRFEYFHDNNQLYKDNNLINKVKHTWVEGNGAVEGETYFDYDADGKGLLERKREVLDSGTAVTEYSYDSFGNMIKQVDPGGRTTQFEYKGNSSGPTKTAVLKPSLTSLREYYPNTGLLKSETDSNGGVTRCEYDKIGRLLKKTNPDATAVSYVYNDLTNEIEMRDERGETSVYKYDNLGRLSEVKRPDGKAAKYQYDPLSKIAAVTDAAGRTARYSYDPVGRLIEVVFADGSSTRVEYDDSKNTVKVVDADGNVTEFKNNGQNELIEVVEATGDKTTYGYSVSGKVREVVDARELKTKNDYDRGGRLVGTEYSDGTRYQFEYDAQGDLVRKTDPQGKRINYSYDELGRITASGYPDPTFDVVRVYDGSVNGKGLLSTVKDPTGTTAFSYDKMGRIVEKTKTVGGNTFKTEFEYDDGGNLLSMKDPAGNLKIYYKYDEMNKVIEVVRGQLSVVSYKYEPSNTINTMTFGNGNTIKYTYDLRDRVDTLTIFDKNGKAILKYDYDYDAVGNLVRHEISPSESFAYGYDKVYRLTNVDFPTEADSVYSYDRAGNRTGLKYAYGDIKYSYEPRSNSLDYYDINLHGKVDYSYDLNGNLIGEEKLEAGNPVGRADYVYDPEDRLIQIKLSQPKIDGVDMEDLPEKVIEMKYDANGMRALRLPLDPSTSSGLGVAQGETTLYHYDLANNVICETDENGKVKATYVYANGMRVARIDPTGKMFYFINDPLGSPIMIADGDGNAVQRYIYDPFGVIMASKGTSDNRYTYTGKEYDVESGLMYYGARFYDPKIGRFTTRDIAAADYQNPQSLNRYVYCLNNPLKYIDPDGRVVVEIHGASDNAKWMPCFSAELMAHGIQQDIYGIKWGGPPSLFNYDEQSRGFAGELSSVIRDIRGKYGKDEPINIFAHSAGTVLFKYLPDDVLSEINNVVFAGSPIDNFGSFSNKIRGQLFVYASSLDPITYSMDRNSENVKFIDYFSITHRQWEQPWLIDNPMLRENLWMSYSTSLGSGQLGGMGWLGYYQY